MTSPSTGKAVRDVGLGLRIVRATATLPATTSTAYFTVAGGRVLVTHILGEVTTIIQTQACNLNLVSNPTVGTSVDLCAVLNISADEVGCLYSITGTPADALIGTNAGLVPAMAKGLIIPVGAIELQTSATNTGATKWQLTYRPLDDGAYVVAA